MKVLLVSPLPPPVGGIASWTENIINYYSLKEYNNPNISIVNLNTALKYRNVTKISLFSRIFYGLLDGFRSVLIFLFFLIKNKPNVIHMSSSGSLGLIKDIVFILISKIFKIPFIIHFHFGRIPEISNLNNWEWKLLHKIVSLSSSSIVLDQHSLDKLISYGFDKVVLIPNPISRSLEMALDSKGSDIDNDEYYRIIFVGHIIPNKGVYELIESFCLLDGVNELFLVGPVEQDVKDKIYELAGNKINSINFLGVLNKNQVIHEIKSSDLLVLPSYTEGFPNVILEAMAMKCPIVASNVGAIPSMLNHNLPNPAGLIIEPKNIQDLYKSIQYLKNNKDEATFYANNAFLKVKNEFVLDNVCAKYEKIWINSVNGDM